MMKRNFFLASTFLFLTPFLAYAVTVSPAKVIIKADPGQKVQAEVIVKNEEGAAKVFRPSLELFTEQEGTKLFTKKTGDLASWISIASSTVLMAGEKKSIPFTLTVPENAPPGGHFAVMWWSGVPLKDMGASKEVSIVTRAGILFYVTVSGDVHVGADIDDFSAGGKFFFRTPIHFGIHVNNTGNDYIAPHGSITIRNFFSSISAMLAVNEKGFQILPASGERFDVDWDSGFALGLYRAEAELSYGDGQKATSSFWFFVLPYWSLLAIIILAVIIWVLKVGIKKYNRWVVERAAASSGGSKR